MEPQIEVRPKGDQKQTHACIWDDRPRTWHDPDGICAWVVARYDLVDSFYHWWCTWHKSSMCDDVKAVQAYRVSDGLNPEPDPWE